MFLIHIIQYSIKIIHLYIYKSIIIYLKNEQHIFLKKGVNSIYIKLFKVNLNLYIMQIPIHLLNNIHAL